MSRTKNMLLPLFFSLASYALVVLQALYTKPKKASQSKWVEWQAATQAKLRPACWQPLFFRAFHEYSYSTTLSPSLSEEAALKKIKMVLQGMGYEPQRWRRGKDKRSYELEAWCFTPSWGWLDLFSLTIEKGSSLQWTLHLRSRSTGVFPLITPLAPLLNLLFCWLPFSDHGLNRRRVHLFLHHLRSEEGPGAD